MVLTVDDDRGTRFLLHDRNGIRAMSRMICWGLTALGIVLGTSTIALGQLPALPTAPSQPVVGNPSALPAAPSLGLKPTEDPSMVMPPPALVGTKAGQSETAVAVQPDNPPAPTLPGVQMLPGLSPTLPVVGSTIPATVADGTQNQPASADMPADGERVTNISLTARRPATETSQNKLTANAREDRALRPNQVGTPPVRTTDQTSFKTMGPTIQVETIGPRSIAINKPAEFAIRVTNSGAQEAKGLTVEAAFPEFIDMMSVRPTRGTFDQQNEPALPRLKWRIENLAPGQTETAILHLTPRTAKLFDFQVQWVADPLRGQASIEVTEPQLDMRIAGPAEVHYGETAIYTVTIRNPGTGIAENVEIMLSEDLGGQRATVGNIEPGEERTFEVELIPGDAGTLSLEAFAKADTVEHSVSKEIIVRRADLEMILDGPPAAYAGTQVVYRLLVKNTGDAIARDVLAAAVLPMGAKYISGIDGAEVVQTGVRWSVGSLPVGEERAYEIHCIYQQAGELKFEAGVRAADDLAATNAINTTVAALADLVLAVDSPVGPSPINNEVSYLIRVKNRGTSPGKNIHVAMQFSEGIEPVSATGASYDIQPGEIRFRPIEQLGVDQEVTIRVQAIASESGNRRFRAVLTCDDPVSEEIAQGTSRFYGTEIITQAFDGQRRETQTDAGLRR